MYLLAEGHFKKAIDHSNAVAPKPETLKKDNIRKTQPIPQTFFNLNEVQGEKTFLTFFSLCCGSYAMLSYEDFLEIFYFFPGWLGNLATRSLSHCATSLERLLSIENL